MLNRIIFLVLAFFIASPAFSQEPLVLWDKEYDFSDIGSKYEKDNFTSFTNLSPLDDGSFIGVGYSAKNQLFISKVSHDGRVIWKQKIYIPAETDRVKATDIKISPSNEILVGGYRLEMNFPDDHFPFLVWFTSDGKPVWVSASGKEDQETRKILQWTENSVLVAESSRYNASYLRKLDIKFKKKDGNLRGKYKTKDTLYQKLPFGKSLLSPAPSDGIYAAMAKNEPDEKHGTTTASGKVCIGQAAKINVGGEVLWQNDIIPHSRNCSISDAITDSDGNLIMSIEQRSRSSSSFGVSSRIVSFDSNGTLRFDFKPASRAAWLQPLNGGEFLAGYENTVTRYSSAGQKRWSKHLEKTQQKSELYIQSATESKSGDILLGGYIVQRPGFRDKEIIGYLSLLSLSAEMRTSYTDESAKRYFRQYVKDEATLIGFYDNVLSACPTCNPLDFLERGASAARAYSSNVETRKRPFDSLLESKNFDEATAYKYIDTVVTSPNEIPYFIDVVLNNCLACDRQSILKRLVSVQGFGANVQDSFFDSIEYNSVLKSLPYEDVVSSYFSYVVNKPADFEIFFNDILAKCTGCDKENYAKLAIRKLDQEHLTINLNSFSSNPTFVNAISLLPSTVEAKTVKDEYLVKLRAGGRIFEKSISGDCTFSRKATNVKDAGFLDTLFTGADARRNYYDVYKCKLSGADLSLMKGFLSSINKSSSFSNMQSKTVWDYYKFTGDDKIVYERAPSTYTPSPSYETSSSSSRSIPKRAGMVTSIKRDGKYTIVECSMGKETKVYHEASGKCSDNYQVGTYGCSSVIKWAKERCEAR